MGFFSSLWNKTKEIASDVVEAAKVTAAVVVAIPLVTPFVIADKLGIINLDGDNKETANELGETFPLTGNSTPAEVQNIVALLRERVEVYRASGEKMESAAKEDINKFFVELTEDYKENEEVARLINFDLIEEDHKNLLKKIDGAYSKIYEKRLSIDDAECRNILAMDSGVRKKTTMLKFTEDLKKKAIENFSETFGNTVAQQENDICKALDNYFNAKATEFEEQRKKFEDWERDMQNQTFDKEKAQLPALEKLYVIEQVEKILAA